jgi:hypothetical protein
MQSHMELCSFNSVYYSSINKMELVRASFVFQAHNFSAVEFEKNGNNPFPNY